MPIPITVAPEIERLNALIVEAIQDLKGIDIVKLDLSGVPDAGAQFFIICHGNSTTHVMGIANSIEKKISEALNTMPNHVEGKDGRHWMLVDYFTTLVHIFSPEKRSYYNLEGLWGDVPSTHYDNMG